MRGSNSSRQSEKHLLLGWLCPALYYTFVLILPQSFYLLLFVLVLELLFCFVFDFYIALLHYPSRGHKIIGMSNGLIISNVK